MILFDKLPARHRVARASRPCVAAFRALNVSYPLHKNNFFGRIKSEQPGLTRMNVNAAAPPSQQSTNPRATPFAYFAYFAVQFFAAFLTVFTHRPILPPLKKKCWLAEPESQNALAAFTLSTTCKRKKTADPFKTRAQNHQIPVNIGESHSVDPLATP